jgi:predicted nucleic acid-binding protein
METSALLAALLEHDPSALKTLRAGSRYVTSALTFAEAGRAVVRARVSGRLSADDERAALRALRTFARRCFIVDVTADVVARVARPFRWSRSALSMPCTLQQRSCSTNLPSS